MAGISTTIIIRRMAGRALCGGIGKSSGMAIKALNRLVCSRKREACRIVIKNYICIAGWVASQTNGAAVGIPIYAGMLVVGFRIGVTSNTSKFCIIGRIGMAICTIAPFPFVFATVYREILHIMVKYRRRPGCFEVANRTIC